ncbi:hypothetical protein [Streptomyces sp. NA02950]|uniref:hypothetical protein n=1 Tax=Streptomyces sp. NA02950 TaxID=2742137 RepID=UPI0020CAB6B7|nr:hypothetical protein [Streptomyces sp. NA02950]
MVRALRNPFTERMTDLEQTGADLEERRAAFATASLKLAAVGGDVEAGKVEAGQSAGLVGSIVPAAEIVRRLGGGVRDGPGRAAGRGRTVYDETVVDGLASAPQALLDLVQGRYTGKTVVWLGS